MNKQRTLLIVGIALASLGFVYLFIYYCFHIDLYKFTPLAHMQCGFRKLTGLYCPGCGGTRSVMALLKGKLLTSLYYHPLPLYCAVLYSNFAVRYLFRKHLKPAKFRMMYVFILVFLLLGNWIARNVLLILGHPM